MASAACSAVVDGGLTSSSVECIPEALPSDSVGAVDSDWSE